MKAKPIVWKPMTHAFSNGHNAFIGRIKVGSVNWNGFDRDESLRYVANCNLPSIGDCGKHPTEEQARQKVEKAVSIWLKEIVE